MINTINKSDIVTLINCFENTPLKHCIDKYECTKKYFNTHKKLYYILITDAVRKNKIAERATDIEIKNTLTSWFRFARDRDGGREGRRTTPSQ